MSPDEEYGGYTPSWSSKIRDVGVDGYGHGQGQGQVKDIWADAGSSDEEDEAYVAARRMLARVAKKEKEGKGKKRRDRGVY